MNNFAYSKRGIALTQTFEQCRLTAYWDSTGKCWSIGWGHTGKDVYEGLVWTQEQADAALLADIKWAVDYVNKHVHYQLDQDEFDALVDFVYNAGVGNFQSSKLIKFLNSGDLVDAALELPKWIYSNHHVLAGLVRRRQAEEELFDSQK